jgi:HEXXH motif-containing protein
MSVASETYDGDFAIASLSDLAPSPSRVDQIDSMLRLRLAESFDYLGGLPSLEPGRRAVLSGLMERIVAGPVSPWLFCLYSKLVAELSRGAQDNIDSFDAVAEAASLPAGQGVIRLRDSTVPDSWWDHFLLLLDTDPLSPFRPTVPTAEEFSRCKDQIAAGLDLMQQTDPTWHGEVKRLLRSIVLGSPPDTNPDEIFNGASTFFLWGAVLLNADLNRAPVSMVDILVHESSHVLLFGLTFNGGLTRNRGEERYGSPVRPDERPIDGIFHACFVTTRVHLAMKRLIDSGSLQEDDRRLALQHLQYNEDGGRKSLAVLTRHAEPTKTGEVILGELEKYWTNQPGA